MEKKLTITNKVIVGGSPIKHKHMHLVTDKISKFDFKKPLSEMAYKYGEVELITDYIDNTLQINIVYVTKTDIVKIIDYIEQTCNDIRAEGINTGKHHEAPHIKRYEVICNEISNRKYKKLYVTIKLAQWTK